jgi:3',5'-cyclic-AMP phosphodiesterase
LTLLVQISDPHVAAADGDRSAATGLAAAVRDVGALRPAPAAVLLSGDVAADGGAPEYERARELLAPLEAPVHALPGNHDDRAGLRAAFGLPGAADEPIRYAAACGDLRLVLCDTTQPGVDDGRLDAAALDWLDAELAGAPAAPTVVAMHHPPVLIGVPPMDAIGLPAEDRAALRALLDRHAQVRAVVAGHVHRATFALLGRCPVVTSPSTWVQVALAPEWPELILEPAPPAFLVHVWEDGELVSHAQPVAAG